MDFVEIMRSIGALLITIGIMIGFALLAKKYGLLNGNLAIKNDNKRLKIIEQTLLDTKGSKLIIARCDNKDELILITQNGGSHIKTLDGEAFINESKV